MNESNRYVLNFSMHLDSNKSNIISLNPGRLTLWDLFDARLVQRWVFSSSTEKKQIIGSWEERGGLCPPTVAMPGMKMYQVPTKRLIQPGQNVDDGFLITFDGNVAFKTSKGKQRSEIMFHEDKGSPGTLGCLGATAKEYQDFAKTFTETCSHLKSVPLGVVYTF